MLKDPVYRKRQWFVGASNAAVWGGTTILLNEIWYKDYPRTAFHTFDDANNWRYMDKCGHAFAAYKLASIEYASWTWAGIAPEKAVWLSGGLSWGYLFTVEVLDGFSEGWGFSYADLGANTIGSGLFVIQQLTWHDQRFRLKFSYKPSEFAKLRPNVLGSTFPERLLKDYNAQSYWISASPGAFLPPGMYFPRWVQLSFGYSAHGMLNGDSNLYTIDGFTYRARSEFAISLDLDWSQVPDEHSRAAGQC